MDTRQIAEHMEVVGSDGVHVGIVDRVEGDRIKLTKRDDGHGESAHHRYIPLDLVASVTDDTVELSAGSDEAATMIEEADH